MYAFDRVGKMIKKKKVYCFFFFAPLKSCLGSHLAGLWRFELRRGGGGWS